MTLVNVTPFFWPGLMRAMQNTPSLTTDQTLNAAGEYYCGVFQARENMTLSHVGWRTGAAVASPTVDTRVETVGADGLPTGALWATNTNIVSGALSSNTFTLHALTASATIVKGDWFAIKIVYASGTSVIVVRHIGLADSMYAVPYRVTNTSGSAVKNTHTGEGLNLALGSSTTTFYQLVKALPLNSITNTAFSNSVAGSKRGLRFQLPHTCRIAGLVWWNSTSVGDFNASLMDDSGTELSSSSTAFEGDRNGVSVSSSVPAWFDNPVTVAKATWYRAAVEPTSATNVTVGFATLPSLDYRSAWPGGTNHHYTTYTTAGSWVDSATDSVPLMDVIIDQIDDGTGSGATGGVSRARVQGGF